ncbi:hypothetical protein [Polycladidibacter stylochi]|uniref:hypothetical protein n=1 Tax=Polycladidibacter stylochi TaxID=1807766 RepID=UPI0008323400|nr:hypothetical protein [Pseudovibrio stylochi]
MSRIFLCAIGSLCILVGCASQASRNPLERQLFRPTGREIPQIRGTRYDCQNAVKQFGANKLWQANVSGRILTEEPSYNVSTKACFATQSECEAFLYLMNGKLEQIIISRCQLGFEDSIF